MNHCFPSMFAVISPATVVTSIAKYKFTKPALKSIDVSLISSHGKTAGSCFKGLSLMSILKKKGGEFLYK